ncbi:MAG: protein kinase [Candidatus Cloacimonetes bacterium]|nr:protein kinase [Candidatus Cloacimonadota bacterium]
MIESTLTKYGLEEKYLSFKNIDYYFSHKASEQLFAVTVQNAKISTYYEKLVEKYKVVQGLVGGMELIDSQLDNNKAIFVMSATDLDPLYEVAYKESLISGNRLIPSLYEITDVLCHNLDNFNFNYLHYKLLFVNSKSHNLQYCAINDVVCHVMPEVDEIFGEEDFLIYRSPEELKGKSVTTRSLLYKFSMMLYQIFTDGRIPFSSVSKEVILNEIALQSYIRPNYYNVSINSSIRNVIQKNLSIDPEKRLQDFEEMLVIIDDINKGFLYHNEFDPSDEQMIQDNFKNKFMLKVLLDIIIAILLIGGIATFVMWLGNRDTKPKIDYTMSDTVIEDRFLPAVTVESTQPEVKSIQKASKVNENTLNKLKGKDLDSVSESLKQYGIYIKKINYERIGQNNKHILLDFIYNSENNSIIMSFTQKGFLMPDYQDNFFNAVKSDFTKRKLRIGNVSYIWTNQEKAGRILKTYPPAGTFVYENDSINLVVGKGENIQ